MRKLILIALMAATIVPSVAEGRRRPLANDRRELRQDRREIREDRRDLREDRRDLRQDRRRVAYAAPYRGWAYRPLTRGYQLRPVFWGPSYLIDYTLYSLTAPRGEERWIRYGDDLVLVNIRTGRVLDVVRGRY
jgi:Ni/Co efflux regulator RcnB